MTKQRKVRIHVESLNASGRRFVHAWQRAERGETVHEEHHSKAWKACWRRCRPSGSSLSASRVGDPTCRLPQSRASLDEITSGCTAMSAPWRKPACWNKTKPGCARRLREPRRSSRSHEFMSKYPPAKSGALGREPLTPVTPLSAAGTARCATRSRFPSWCSCRVRQLRAAPRSSLPAAR